MLYKDFLKDLTNCPFCEPERERILENEHAYLTYARVPYHKHHLLVIPKRHAESLKDISKEEMFDINALEEKTLDILFKLGYKNISWLVREGNTIDKSIKHVHFHIIPEISLGDRNSHGDEREMLTESQVAEVLKEIKSAF